MVREHDVNVSHDNVHAIRVPKPRRKILILKRETYEHTQNELEIRHRPFSFLSMTNVTVEISLENDLQLT